MAKADRRARRDGRPFKASVVVWLSFAVFGSLLPYAQAHARVATPTIRTTHSNAVPACVTPDRLMAFLKTRNRRLDPRFKDIAAWYKRHGEAWHVRWDYAFFQMALETNFLTYRQGNGRWGDVDPRQNNFAGLGTTGGGVPGDSYPDVSTGVLAQIQHLVVYSGERIPEPVGHRTRLKQDVILDATKRGGRYPMTFADLAGRWAVDKRYGKSIEWVANSFRSRYCKGLSTTDWREGMTVQAANPAPPPIPVRAKRQAKVVEPKPEPQTYGFGDASAKASQVLDPPKPAPAQTAHKAANAPAKAPASPACKVLAASYGGKKTLLLRQQSGQEIRFTALTILEGFERSMVTNYVKVHAPGSTSIGEFADRDAALAKAHELCRSAAQMPRHATARAG